MSQIQSDLTQIQAQDIMDSIMEEENFDPVQESDLPQNYDKARRYTMRPPFDKSHSSESTIKNVHFQTLPDPIKGRQDHDDETDSFDTFVLNHFQPYSGKEDVINRLNDTEQKFNQHCFCRSRRYAAISLLVTNEAKRCYIKHRKNFATFDDFYEFLMTNLNSILFTEIDVPSSIKILISFLQKTKKHSLVII